ncbi:hypothetical protein J2T38_002082 [Neisseria perflava]|uniref:DUF4189 domain-containing protein n=1 Tax=Neisseria perflava TaxID=33053 RepID=UPI0020A1262E|nr:DUF4189 domain-containing protein [Neisseria perflava]MCP1773233.1 hypothetical protein [Neisseria perflava]
MKTLPAFILAALLPAAHAADTYGYIAFWQNPDRPEVVTVTKTTQEGADKAAAQAEVDDFCREQDRNLVTGGKVPTGCLSITALKNTCAAAAWPRAQGLLKYDNVVVVQNTEFKKTGKAALAQCRLKYGEAAGCEVETVFCTSAQAYGSHSGWLKFWRKVGGR